MMQGFGDGLVLIILRAINFSMCNLLGKIHDELPASCMSGVSSNRTCEIGLTAESGRTYRSVAYLLEECSRTQTMGAC